MFEPRKVHLWGDHWRLPTTFPHDGPGTVHEQTALYRFGPFRMDVAEQRLFCNDDIVVLTPKAFELLLVLVKSTGRLVTRDDLLKNVWRDTFVEEANLNYTISLLRKALGDSTESPKYIETVPRRGYRFVAPVSHEFPRGSRFAKGSGLPAAPRTPTRRRRVTRWVAAFAIAFLLIGLSVGVGYVLQSRRLTWVYGTALPNLERLRNDQDYDGAFRLAHEIERVIPGDRRLQYLKDRVSWAVPIDTEPTGADAFVRGYLSSQDWIPLGRTPIRDGMIPAGFLRFRFQKDGFEQLDVAVPDRPRPSRYLFRLTPRNLAPPGMVFVPGGDAAFGDRIERLDDYWMDRFEVTNSAFAEFVRAGGYHRPEFWKFEFLKDGKRLSWQEATALLKDSTGQPGPATWQAGTHPSGQAQFPVGGVSWHEAAAYAAFVQKELPTAYHWFRASGIGRTFSEQIAFASNFSATGPAAVGKGGLSTFGIVDLAGNVREWSATGSDQGFKFLMGGGWGDPLYVPLTHPDGSTPFDRSPNNGFRCVRYTRPINSALLAVVAQSAKDYYREKPINDAVFALFKQRFSYDPKPLNARVDSTDDTAEWWTDQTISFDAAYEDRMVAHILLPKHHQPPYQVVFFYPGNHAFTSAWSHPMTTDRIEFILRNGRAVVYPLFKGMHERPATAAIWGLEYRDRVVEWQRDLGRAVDYAATRRDLDIERAAFYGFSNGGILGPLFMALDDRIKAGVLVGGGIYEEAPEIYAINYLSRVRTPTLVIHGRYDPIRPLETHGRPVFDLLGVPTAHKRLAIAEAGHIVPQTFLMSEMLQWLDKYLGPVSKAGQPQQD